MKFEFNTIFPRVCVVTLDIFEDSRGSFMESYNFEKFKENGIKNKFIQDNYSKSAKGVIRGMHFQNFPHAQAKLVRVLNGQAIDIILDLNPGPTFGKAMKVLLTPEIALFIPRGFAHGFQALSDVDFCYKIDNSYNKESENGIHWKDERVYDLWDHSIEPIVSYKDTLYGFFEEIL